MSRVDASLAQLMKRFKSTLEMDPIGLMSADEQSYLVKFGKEPSLSGFSSHRSLHPQVHRRDTVGRTRTDHGLAQLMKRFKSTLEMDPIGLMSADEQSYLVK
jgi:hypothetical protein